MLEQAIIPATDSIPLAYRMVRNGNDTQNGSIFFLLHGMGSNENALLKLTSVFPPNSTVIAPRAPYEMSPGRYSWYHAVLSGGKPSIRFAEAERSRSILLTFINGILETLNRRGAKVILGGFSQGGVMTYNTGLTHPELFRGIFILGSRLQEEIRPFISTASALHQLPVFIGHGIEDLTLSLKFAHESKQYLASLGIHPTYHEYPAGHTITPDMMQDLGQWVTKLG